MHGQQSVVGIDMGKYYIIAISSIVNQDASYFCEDISLIILHFLSQISQSCLQMISCLLFVAILCLFLTTYYMFYYSFELILDCCTLSYTYLKH